MTYQAVRRTPRPGQPSSTRHLGLRRAGGCAGLADAVPMLPPQRLAILGYDDADIGPRERYLPGPPLSHADGKHVAAGGCNGDLTRVPAAIGAGRWPPVAEFAGGRARYAAQESTGCQLADCEPIWQYTAQAPGGPREIYYARQTLRDFRPSGR